MFAVIQLAVAWFFKMPVFIAYQAYDRAESLYKRLYLQFYGWGIHLYTGKFGQGKTSAMVIIAYELCLKYPQLTILTNLNLTNFPPHTKIIKLNHVDDILNAPNNCLVLIDEIGTLFNSRDFVSNKKGERPVPKPLFQHLCQCRKRKMMILATVQRFNLLDKQIRDITATVTACRTTCRHPFSRAITLRKFDIDEYEKYTENRTYTPVILNASLYIQTNKYRQLYDTAEMVDGMLKMDFLSDKEILENRGETTASIFGDKETNKSAKKRPNF